MNYALGKLKDRSSPSKAIPLNCYSDSKLIYPTYVTLRPTHTDAQRAIEKWENTCCLKDGKCGCLYRGEIFGEK